MPIGRSIPFPDYQSIEAVNISSLKYGLVSMAHYKNTLESGADDSSPRAFGRMAHCATFEPEEIERRYVVGQIADDDPEGNRRTAEGKKAHALLFPDRPTLQVEQVDAWGDLTDAVRVKGSPDNPSAGVHPREDGQTREGADQPRTDGDGWQGNGQRLSMDDPVEVLAEPVVIDGHRYDLRCRLCGCLDDYPRGRGAAHYEGCASLSWPIYQKPKVPHAR